MQSLSGGNQQKALLARWLATSPKVLIVDEPTRGIDVGAKAEIHRMLREYAAAGNGVIVVSSEMPELIGLCDRILVLHEGRLAGEVAGEAATEEALIHLAMEPSTHCNATLERNRLMIVRSMGKQLRMRRIFRNGKALVLPLDHPIYFGPQKGTEDPAQLLGPGPGPRRHGRAADRRRAASAVHEVGDLGIILRIDATLVAHGRAGYDHAPAPHPPRRPRRWAPTWWCSTATWGSAMPRSNRRCCKKLATVSAQCERIGMPLCGEIIPRVSYTDPAQTMPTSADLAMAIRLGLEYGCDVVKTVYNGDPEGYAKAVASGHLPVIMAGGPKTTDELAIFRQLHEAMTHGASGAAIGRRVWGSERPAATLDAIRAIVIDGASAEEAIAIYRRPSVATGSGR